jgi:hypothetical protein
MQRKRYHANLESKRAYNRKYRARNREKINAQERARWHAKRAANRDKTKRQLREAANTAPQHFKHGPRIRRSNMATDGPDNWRIRPPATAAHEIHNLALRETDH